MQNKKTYCFSIAGSSFMKIHGIWIIKYSFVLLLMTQNVMFISLIFSLKRKKVASVTKLLNLADLSSTYAVSRRDKG